MSVVYAVEAKLYTKFEKEIILNILKNGHQLGFVYFDQIEGERYLNSPILNPICATEKILKGSEYGRNVLTKFEDTYFDFVFDSIENNHFKLGFSCFSYPWTKEFWNSGSDISKIDFSRYIRLMLKLCKDFNLIDLKIIEIG